MFDKKKIILNHILASKCRNKRAQKFFYKISSMLLERSEIEEDKNYSVLELSSRNNILRDLLKKKKIKNSFVQTILTKEINKKYNYVVISDTENQIFNYNCFDICYCIFSLNTVENPLSVFKNIYNVLVKNGKFLTVLPSQDNLKEFKSFFFDYFDVKKNTSFHPYLDIQTLGNIGYSSSFKNVIVDKESFSFQITEASELWLFIRSLGEGNSLLNRNEFKLNKTVFKKFKNDYNQEIKNGSLRNNTLSFNFFIGTK